MQLIEINPERYRQHLNKVIFACIGSLAIGSLSISQLLIQLFPSPEGTHFHWNLLGVVIMAGLVLFILIKLKAHSYFYEISYVWDLKQAINKINRKMQKIEQAVQQGDPNAMQILYFSYSASRQLWKLDNNTLTLNHLVSLENKLAVLAEKKGVELNVEHYNNQQLAEY